VGSALNARSGEWPERGRTPLSAAEVEEALAAVGMDPLAALLSKAAEED
jgi:hypothetical protein